MMGYENIMGDPYDVDGPDVNFETTEQLKGMVLRMLAWWAVFVVSACAVWLFWSPMVVWFLWPVVATSLLYAVHWMNRTRLLKRKMLGGSDEP